MQNTINNNVEVNEIKKSKISGPQQEARAAYIFLTPYIILFVLLIIIPVVMAMCLSFTIFDTVNTPRFVFFNNYIYMLTRDSIFMQNVLPNTIIFSLIVGPFGYGLAFLLAWCLSQITPKLRTLLAIVIYSPSMTMGVSLTVLWSVIFSGNDAGYLNVILFNLGLINEPVLWLTNPDYLLTIMIIVSLWSSFGVGFLGMLSGLLNVNPELYEAASIDGIKNKFQEIFYITIPSMKGQMLFGAVMAIVGTFSSAGVGVALSGSNPTPQYAGQLIINHIDDYAYGRYEMGYAAALSVVLLLIILLFSKVAYTLFGERD